MEFASGAHATIYLSTVAHIGDRDMEQAVILHGEAGSLQVHAYFDGVEQGAVIRGARYDEERFRTIPIPDALWGNVDRTDFARALIPGLFTDQAVGPRLFIDCILADRLASPDCSDGLKAQVVVDAALESHRSSCRVALP